MVKGRVGAANKGKKPESTEQAGTVVTSGDVESHRMPFDFKTLEVPLIAVAVLAVVVAGVVAYKHHQDNKVVLTPIPTLKQYSDSQVDKLKANPPPANASLQTKLNYYDNLYKQEVNAGDAKAATAAFSTRLKLSGQGLNYYNYYAVAKLYQQIGDKATALQMLDKAEATMPPDDPDTGFKQSDAESNIAAFRQELQ